MEGDTIDLTTRQAGVGTRYRWLGELIGQGIDPAGDDIGKVGIVH
jgi:hypothetical protein